MEIKSDLTKGLDEEEYLKRGKPTEENRVVETEASVESNTPIVKPKVKKPKTQKQLDALAKAREAKANKRKVKLTQNTEEVETEEVEQREPVKPVRPVKPASTDSYNPNLEKQHSGGQFDYDRIINGVFSKMSAREEKRDAEARAKKEKEAYEANIRKDERTRIMSEFEKRKAQQPPKRSLDPNQFLRPKTHGIDWDAAFRPR